MLSAEIVPTYRAKLAGGDFPEGWQYGDMVGAILAIYGDAESRAGAGRPLRDALPWLRDAVAYRTHALLPDGRHTFDEGDWSDKPAVAPPHMMLALAATLPPTDVAARQAQALARLAADPGDEWHWMVALGDDPSRAADDPRRGPTSYFSPGTATVTGRTDWSPQAVWVGIASAPSLSDHQHLDAGHFEIVRGGDMLAIDAGGYGSFSSLSHNVIAVDDGKANDTYAPNQGTWSTGARIARHEDTGRVVYALADYASAYDPAGYPQDHPQRSVTRAQRELLFSRAPVGGAPESARVVVYDRVTLTSGAFRTSFLLHGGARPEPGPGGIRFTVGRSALVATTILPARAAPVLVQEPTNLEDGPWYANDPPEGTTSVRVEVRSPTGETERRFLHAMTVGPSDAKAPVPARIEGDGVDGVAIDDEAYLFVHAAPQTSAAPLRWRAPAAATRQIVASLAEGGRYDVRAAREGDQCRLELTPGGSRAASAAGLLELDLGPGCALR
jgi:hypothetical protein